MVLRDLRPDDIDEIFALEQQTPFAPHWQRSEYQELFAPADPLRRNGVVALIDSAIAGFAIAKVLIVDSHIEAELETIVVRREAQQKGVGGELMKALLTRVGSDGASELRLEVRPSNTAAIALYKACGFRRTGWRRGYYRQPDEDALLMEVQLPFSSLRQNL